MSEEGKTTSDDGSQSGDEGSTSLLGGSTELSEGEYYLSDGIKGSGDKPEWYQNDHFKSVAEQARAYPELHKKFGSFTGTPKDGYALPDGVEKDDALATEFISLAEKLNMNQEGFDEGLQLYFSQDNASTEINIEGEMAKLGEGAAARIASVEGFMRNNLGEDFDKHMGAVSSAESVELVEALIKATAPKKLPIHGGESPQGLTWENIEVEMHKKDENGRSLRSTNPAHNAKVERMIKEFGG